MRYDCSLKHFSNDGREPETQLGKVSITQDVYQSGFKTQGNLLASIQHFELIRDFRD
jgi:hypothetical protein